MLKPLADRIIVKATSAEEVTKGGIVLPDTAREKPQEGEVIAVGPGRILDSGKVAAMDVKVGDKVIYSKYGGTEIKLNGDEFWSCGRMMSWEFLTSKGVRKSGS